MVDNRLNIMRIALRLFAHHGYDAVGVQQIVTEAGVTKPTLYHYFENKLGLFQAIVAHHTAELLPTITQAAYYEHDIRYSITKVVQAYFEYAQRQPNFYRLMLSTWFAPSSSEYAPIIAELHHQQYLLLEQLFLAAADDHGNMTGRHQRYAVSLRGMIDTYIGLAFQGKIDLNDADLIYKIGHQYMHGIFS